MAPPGATERQRPASLSSPGDDPAAPLKEAAAHAAAELVRDGMRVGLGTGTTVAHLLPALAARGLTDVRFAATSPETERAALALGLAVVALDELGELDLTIDGADQIDPQGWLIKGGGGAHTRERIVAAAARRFVVIASAEKEVQRLEPPVPLELLSFGVEHTLALLAPTQLRDAPPSPDGGVIADYRGPVEDPRALADRLSATPGVVDHGLFAPEMVSEILIAGPDGVRRRAVGGGATLG
jgi:ribose 5-phosphate isomerase A